VRRLLSALPDGTTELYVHAATRRWGEPDPLPASYAPEAEYAALIDPEIKAWLSASGVALATFGDLTDRPRDPATPAAAKILSGTRS
jgi:hypothetical protein